MRKRAHAIAFEPTLAAEFVYIFFQSGRHINILLVPYEGDSLRTVGAACRESACSTRFRGKPLLQSKGTYGYPRQNSIEKITSHPYHLYESNFEGKTRT